MARVDKKISTTLLIRLKKSGVLLHIHLPTQFGRNLNTRFKSLDFSAADALGWSVNLRSRTGRSLLFSINP